MIKPAVRKLIAYSLFLALALSGLAYAADPPSRVARLAYVAPAASFSPGGERDWGRAVVNRPLVTGDRLWVERGARAELQLGSAAIRVGGSTSLALLNLDDRNAQVELTQGTLNIRVRRLDRGQVFEVDTPILAYSIRRPGSYRIQVDQDGVTTVTVRVGQAEIYGEGSAFIVRERQALRFYDSGLRDYQTFASWPVDEFDRWSSERDRRWDNSPSRRYVAAELIGYEDLDSYGGWRRHRDYGYVWVPNRLPAGWAPYRDGHWAWIEPWGWTWVDEAPWGFAPSHYGRWAYLGDVWAWVPGPAKAPPVYAPALVAFIGGSNLQSGGSGGAVGWFPLGPRDVYRPPYSASREYFSNVNTSNTVINQADVASYYGNRNVNVTYANQQIPGAVIAVLAAAFAQSRPVARETVRVSREMVARAPAAAVAPVAPVQASVVGPAAPPSAKPPERAHSRPVVAQTAPPPPPVPFAAKQSALAANAGKPLDSAAIAALKPAVPASAPAVKVVPPTQPVAAPAKPASAPAPTASAATATATAPAGSASTTRPRPSGTPSAPQAAAPAAAGPAPAAGPATAPVTPSQASPSSAAASARDARPPRGEEEGGAKRRPSLTPNAPETARSASAAAAAPATPAARPTPAVPAGSASPAAPATPATPATRATPAAPAAPASQPTRATPAVPASPATPATRATPAVPATPATPAASATPAPRATPASPPAAPSASAPAEAAPRARNAAPRGREAGDARPAPEAQRSQPPAAPPAQPRPPAAVPPAAAPAASRAPGPAASRAGAAAAPAASAAERRRQRDDEERKP
jgi:hypothetical protein